MNVENLIKSDKMKFIEFKLSADEDPVRRTLLTV